MGRKIKVLHVIPNFGAGGAERLVLDLMEETDHDKFEVAAVSLYAKTGTILEDEIRKKGLRVFYLDKHKGLDLTMIPKLGKVFKHYKPDVVHTHRYVLRYTVLPSLLCRVPVCVHTIHNIAQNEVDWVGRFIHKMCFSFANVVPVSISEEVATSVRQVYGAKIRTPVIYNGVKTTLFPSYSGVDQTKDIEETIILHVGRFSPQKNHRLLLEAFSLASAEYPKLKLWLVGDGELRPLVEEMAQKLGLGDRILFLGIRSDVHKLLEQADIFVLSSDWEGMPLSILEAMAAGKPVVATAVGGVPELVENGLTGLLVPPDNANALAEALLLLAKHPELRQVMGQNGQKKAIDCFDISRTAREYEALYCKLLEERKGAI
ncbi:glycosyltransferase [Coprothermobacter proteolyticus]|uniref:glycosyltransferase n=1 Tax=Coprothermobacter proteolyticus TaxID=35786 RepID=UPI000D3094E7|nr:glycosyltransferase [Coprothermobacter proteolyticus]